MLSVVSRVAAAAAVLLALAACGTTTSSGGTTAPDPYLTGRAIQGWGANDHGQLGDGSLLQRLTPTPARAIDNVRAIAAGGNESLALLTDGTVWQWGNSQPAPVQVPGLSGVTAIAAGGAHFLALTSSHLVYAWGANDSGQLGDGTTTNHYTPVQVNNLTNAVAIAAGRAHSVAIRADLSVVAWGANNKGQLGDSTTTGRLTPVPVSGLSAIEVATSTDTTLAVTSNASVAGWGSNRDCQLGINPPVSGPISTPVCDDSSTPLSLGGNVATNGHAIAATATTVFIRTTQKTVDALGGLDPGCTTANLIPYLRGSFSEAQRDIVGQRDIVAVVAGPKHALMLSANGEVLASGANSAGQLGTGTAGSGACLVNVAGLSGATAVAAGDAHSLAVVAGVASLTPAASPAPFPSTPLGANSTVSFTLTNTGLAPLGLYGFAASGDFQLTTTQCPRFPASLPPGASCPLTVAFAPAATGPRTGTLTVRHDGVGGTLTASLLGTGTDAKVAFDPARAEFGDQPVGAPSHPQTVTLRNDGDATLTVNTVTATAGFDIAGSSCPGAQVAANGGTCAISVTFRPTEAKLWAGEVRVTYNGGKPAAMTVHGTGIAPGSIAPASVTFPDIPAGSASAATVLTVTDAAAVPMDIGAAAVSGPFQITADTCSNTELLTTGDSCTIAVRFQPAAAGPLTGQLTVPANGGLAVLNAPLAGTGT
jgi:regulator of chromosome condensation (RCC1) repeat-containing protein/HYDIN/CFA65/VesB family protein/Regulator of Chromosome Condensation (RCC1) repeat protein